MASQLAATPGVSNPSINNFVSLSALLGAECSHCGRRSVTLCQCPCKKAYYCDVGCQRSHWQQHKDICTKAQRHISARLNRCASCGSLSNVLKICGCGTVFYCSLDCQRKHYGVHRRICTVAQGRAAKNTLSGGKMLSAYGDDAPAGDSVTSQGTQTDETCHQLLKIQQERLQAASAERNKHYAHERRKSVIAQNHHSGAMAMMNSSVTNLNPNHNNNNNNNNLVNLTAPHHYSRPGTSMRSGSSMGMRDAHTSILSGLHHPSDGDDGLLSKIANKLKRKNSLNSMIAATGQQQQLHHHQQVSSARKSSASSTGTTTNNTNNTNGNNNHHGSGSNVLLNNSSTQSNDDNGSRHANSLQTSEANAFQGVTFLNDEDTNLHVVMVRNDEDDEDEDEEKPNAEQQQSNNSDRNNKRREVDRRQENESPQEQSRDPITKRFGSFVSGSPV